ncbi:MerR family transcriptional regulator [Micromonospora wenchangensis]|uniref:MerR family transcriptional regulator n=1 Tax=Micromonospora wenchangensis TaxID=1185415 RepID=UPI0034416B21
MLTIGRLASYAGVTIRAVRHYHQIGLLPEPERDASGYRTYDAAAVVRLVRIRTLAEAGVPLARVRELLDADAETFAAATTGIDRQLRSQIRTLQEHRRRIARLGGGDTLAVPAEVVDYLDRLRAAGVPPIAVQAERDGWILMAARWPDAIPGMMAELFAQAEADGELAMQEEVTPDPAFVRLMDAFADAAHPVVRRLRGLVADRGWTGWTVVEKRRP